MSDLRDSIEQAISDSLDADWKPSWAADAIMELPIVAAAPALLASIEAFLEIAKNPAPRADDRVMQWTSVAANAALTVAKARGAA